MHSLPHCIKVLPAVTRPALHQSADEGIHEFLAGMAWEQQEDTTAGTAAGKETLCVL
jgi:hypothetical protein